MTQRLPATLLVPLEADDNLYVGSMSSGELPNNDTDDLAEQVSSGSGICTSPFPTGCRIDTTRIGWHRLYCHQVTTMRYISFTTIRCTSHH